MPNYVYKCPACGNIIEKIRPVDLRDLPVLCVSHPCEMTMVRVQTAPAVHMKGKGWPRGQRTLK
jgi:putative FmdB family regulatory protein